MRNKYIFLLTFLFIIPILRNTPCFAEESLGQQKNQFPIEISFINQASSMPFNSTILKTLHPGFSLGTEYLHKDGLSGDITQSLTMGYYDNKYMARAFFLYTAGGYRYTLPFGLFGDITLGLGYQLSFHPSEVYKLNADGEYEKVNSPGRSAFLILGSIGIGYDFGKKIGWPLDFFIRYQPYVQTPFSTDESWWPHAMLYAGIRVRLWKGGLQ